MLSRYIKDWTITEYLCKILPMQSSINNKRKDNMSNYTPVISRRNAIARFFRLCFCICFRFGSRPQRSLGYIQGQAPRYFLYAKGQVSTAGPRITKADLVDAIARAMALDVDRFAALIKLMPYASLSLNISHEGCGLHAVGLARLV